MGDIGAGAGVYVIKHTESGNEYIGSSVRVHKRFLQHKNALNTNTHNNKYLQNAWNKYGKKAFEFKILLVCALEHVRFYEQTIIDGTNPVYNLSKSAYSGVPAGSVCSKEHVEKIRVASIKHWEGAAYRDKVVKAIQVSMTREECSERSIRTAKLWGNPEYRNRAVAARIGKAYNKGYKCTALQVENRRKAARISNMKRNYSPNWVEEYIRRYPKYSGDVNGF